MVVFCARNDEIMCVLYNFEIFTCNLPPYLSNFFNINWESNICGSQIPLIVCIEMCLCICQEMFLDRITLMVAK